MEFFSGYFYGITGFDISDQIEECFVSSLTLSQALSEGLES